MLNEIREFEQYSFCLKTADEAHLHQNSRLKRKALITNGFSGLERAMTMVARRYMFARSSVATPESIETARMALKQWCGSKSVQADAETQAIKDWLPDYIRYSLLQDCLQELRKHKTTLAKVGSSYLPIYQEAEGLAADAPPEVLRQAALSLEAKGAELEKKNLQNRFNNEIKPILGCIERLDNLESKRREFAKSLFLFNERDVSSNDYKRITYDSILMKAFEKGPLKRYYLYCDDKCLLNRFELEEKKKDLVLKTIAAFLLGTNSEFEHQEWTAINKTDIVNWLVGSSKVEEYQPNKILLFEKEQSVQPFKTQRVADNCVKLHVIPDIIEHFRLVEEGDPPAEDIANGVFYADKGSNVYLSENEKYTPMQA